jgi:F420 biosynthesis protein FbiB-like protein
MGRRLREDMLEDGLTLEKIEKDVARSYQRITGAPLVLLVCLSMEGMDSYEDEARQRCEWLMAAQSTAMAGQNLLLTAHSLGLGACWMCAPLFCPDVVGRSMSLPADWEPQGLITLGYPDEERVRTRRPIDEITVKISGKNGLLKTEKYGRIV